MADVTPATMGQEARRRCDARLDDPPAPEVLCERPRGHASKHRKTLGGAAVTWLNTEGINDRTVVVHLPTFGHHGGVGIGDREVSRYVSGVSVRSTPGDITRITLDVIGTAIDVTAEGVGELAPDVAEFLVALGWAPPTIPGDPS